MSNEQDKDRPALIFYSRIWSKYLKMGPVLEFGCGVGHFIRRIAQNEMTYALEINEYARSQVTINSPSTTLLKSIDQLKEDTIGSIVSLHVLEHINDEELIEIGISFNRILKSNGRILITVPNLSGKAHLLKLSEWSGFSDITHINLKTSEQWRTFFETKWGVSVIAEYADGFYDFPYEKGLLNILIKDGFRLLLTVVQFLSSCLFIKKDYGENVIFLLEKSK